MEGLYIERIEIENFKCFKERFILKLNTGANIIVGDNESGKSTILEALHLALTGMLHGKYLKNELTQYIFNKDIVAEYITKVNEPESNLAPPLPRVVIDVYFASDCLPLFEGDDNSKGISASGISYRIAFDDKYQAEYEKLVQVGSIKTIPIEYYDVSWVSFARQNITARSLPVKSALIDSSVYRYQNGSDIYISRIIKDLLGVDDVVNIAQAHRKMKDSFIDDSVIQNINKKIKAAANISNKDVKLSVELSSKNAWENSLMTYLDNVPFHYVGKGEQCVVKTRLALSHRKSQEANVLLIEEPENHLSHSRLNQLIDEINCSNNQKQIIITTHNSFVANKLGLGNLILLNEQKSFNFEGLSEGTKKFFQKLAGYDTLRLILCKKAILVEGDSDELIIQKAYRIKHNKLPIQDGIDVISVGTSFLRFLEVAKKLKKSVVAVTDNDGDLVALEEKYSSYLGKNKEDYIKICFDKEIDSGEPINGESFNYNTLEPKLLKSNGYDLSLFNKIFDRTYDDVSELHKFMRSNKTDCALRVFDTAEHLNFPQYIIEAICDEQ